MINNRRKNSNPTIKEEIDTDKSTLARLLHGSETSVNNSNNKNKNKITKPKIRVLIPVSKVKKRVASTQSLHLLSIKGINGPWITQEQIKKLIDYITKDKMTTKEAAKKAGMRYASALRYHMYYRNDRTRRLPLPRIVMQKPGKIFTYEEVKKLIGYIVQDKMSVGHAAKKVNMSSITAQKYYLMYKDDPNHAIPEPGISKGRHSVRINSKHHTTEHVKQLIDYVDNGKMAVTAAAKKIGISKRTALKYYNKYTSDPERKIPVPDKGYRVITSDQVKDMIGHIVNDNMSITVASRKANMSEETGKFYYQKYLKDPKNKSFLRLKRPTDRLDEDCLKLLMNYIFKDKLKVKEAAKKVGISRGIAFKHYYKYIKDPSQYDFIPETLLKDTKVRHKFDERLKKMFEYIVDDKMSLAEASKKADVGKTAAARYYEAYLKDPERKIPQQKKLGLSIEKVRELLKYIIHDKMSIKQAGEKSKVCYETTRVHYNKYMDYVNGDTSVSLEDNSNHIIPKELLQVFSEIRENKTLTTETAQSQQTLTPVGPKRYRTRSCVESSQS